MYAHPGRQTQEVFEARVVAGYDFQNAFSRETVCVGSAVHRSDEGGE